MSIEKKAFEAYNKNRELKPKYHIPESCWIDWFTAGYKRAIEDQQKIEPLEFNDSVAKTPFGIYRIKFRSFEFEVLKDETLIGSFFCPEDAYNCAFKDFINNINKDLDLSEAES